MKVLMVTTSYPRYHSDAAGIFVKRTCEALAEKGVDITILAPNDDIALGKEVKERIRIRRFNYCLKKYQKLAYGFGGIPVNLRNNKLLYFLLPTFLLSFLVHLVSEARRCDLIHANWLFNGYFSALVGMITKKPVILTLRGEDVKVSKRHGNRFALGQYFFLSIFLILLQ